MSPRPPSTEHAGFLYYVMPYEEGQALREKLARELPGAIGRPDYEVRSSSFSPWQSCHPRSCALMKNASPVGG